MLSLNLHISLICLPEKETPKAFFDINITLLQKALRMDRASESTFHCERSSTYDDLS